MHTPLIRSKAWVKFFIITLLVLLGSVFVFNYSIDPFGDRNWIVDKHYKPIVHERSEKYTYIFHEKHYRDYNCVILGSSRVMTLQIKPEEKCYNFGVHVANNPEKLFILEEWVKHAPLKRVYLGNELYNFHTKTDPLKLNPTKFTHGSESNYLSFQTFSIGVKALNNKINHAPQTHFSPHGTIIYSPVQSTVLTQSELKQRSLETFKSDYIDFPFSYEPKALIPLQKIKQLCEKHHIELTAFITPTYTDLHSLFQQNSRLSAANDHFRKDLVSVFGTVYDFDVIHDYHQNPAYFYDPIHYRPHLAEKLFERFTKENGYGILLKSQSNAL